MQSNDTTSKPLHQSINASCNALRFCAGNPGNIQRRIIRHILRAIDAGLDHMPAQDRLMRTGTTAIREATRPCLNPLDAVSALRRLNGHDCILTIPLPELRISEHGRAPGHYTLPANTRAAWREALKKPQHATGAGEAQS